MKKHCHQYKKSHKPKVIDADALKALSFKDFNNAILTPHERELELMLINSGKEFLLPKLKVSNAKEKGMTKAGTGDVLAGLITGFLAKSKDLFKSAVAGCFINGYVGDLLLKKRKH